MPITTKKAIAELSIDTQTLERRLLTVGVGETVSYDELSGLIGRDVQNGARGLLTTARRRLLKNNQMVFDAVANQGVKRLGDEAIASLGDPAINRIHNAARRGVQRITCVQDFDKLPNALKVKHNMSVSLLGAMAHMTRSSSIKKLETRVTNAQHDAMPVAKFLEAMRESL